MDVINDEQNHRFYAVVDDNECFVEYTLEDGVIDFKHTYVPPELRGRGIARQMYQHIAEWLAEQESQGKDLKIKTSCSYANRYFNEK